MGRGIAAHWTAPDRAGRSLHHHRIVRVDADPCRVLQVPFLRSGKVRKLDSARAKNSWLEAGSLWLHHLEYANVPHNAVDFEIASNVNTGMSSPEKNATLSVFPATYVAIHCVSSSPHKVFFFRKRCAAGIFSR